MNPSPSRPRWAGASALALAAMLCLTACSSDKLEVVPGTGSAQGSSQTPGATAAPAQAVGYPLIAADLPAWSDAVLPGWSAMSLVQPCGEPTGLRDLQSAVRPAALTTPTGITVLNQVADYSADPVAAINDTLSRALLACPAYNADGLDVSVRALPAAEGTTAAGAEVTRTDPATGHREVTIYWAALTGTQTVEVAVTAQLGAAGDPPLAQFALDVLAAAQAKALGQAVPAVSAPALPEVRTYEEEAAARAEIEASRAQGSQFGLDDATTGLLTPEEAAQRAAEQAAGAVPSVPTPGIVDHGIDGESGPGTITGTITEEEAR